MSAAAPAPAAPRPGPRALAGLLVLSVGLGIVNGLVFLGFEWVIKHGTDWIWNDLANTDEVRWRVIPLAILLSVVYGVVLKLVREPRWVPPHLNPLAAADGEPVTPTVWALAVIAIVGIASLVGGASLGPEAPLVALAMGMGLFVAGRVQMGPAGQVLVLASIGALLVAFFGSLIPLLIPVLVLYQRTKRLPIPALLSIAACGLAAWGMLWLIQSNDNGFGAIPSEPINPRDYLAAILLGIAAVGVGVLLKRFVTRLAVLTKRISDGTAWWVAALVFGAVLGILYLIGGQSVQFSGQEGSGILLSDPDRYGAWALAGIAVIKLAATSWSLSSGYRGGLVFPSVFVGVAVSLCVETAVPSLAGPGVLLGSIGGLLAEMTSPALGAVMLLALLPAKLLPLGLVAAGSAALGRRLLDRVVASPDESDRPTQA